MKRALLAVAALATATAGQAVPVQIGFTSPVGDVHSNTQTYSNGSYSVKAYGYSNFNFSTNTGTANNLYDKNNGGDENGLGLLGDPSGNHEIWYAGDNFTTIPAVIVDVSSLLSKVSTAQFMMGSTTSNEQWILRGRDKVSGAWTLVNILSGTTESSWMNLPGWGKYSQYAFISGGTLVGVQDGDADDRTRGNVLLSGLLLTPVPEPASWAMMLTGFGAMGLALRRRRDGGRVKELARA